MKNNFNKILGCMLALGLGCAVEPAGAYAADDGSRQAGVERLGRGAVAVRTSPDTVMVGWRYLSSDPLRVAFNVYRDGERLTPEPVAVSTQFFDPNASTRAARYEVRPVVDGRELPDGRGACVLPADAPCGYLEIPLQQPESQLMPDGSSSLISLFMNGNKPFYLCK